MHCGRETNAFSDGIPPLSVAEGGSNACVSAHIVLSSHIINLIIRAERQPKKGVSFMCNNFSGLSMSAEVEHYHPQIPHVTPHSKTLVKT